MRLRKTADEIELMRQAAAISDEAHRAAARIARGGTYEYELEAVLDYTFRRRGGSGPAYASIVGGGRNATILHYIANDQPLVDGELVLIDAGCEYAGYASDVTRTYPVGGRYTGPAARGLRGRAARAAGVPRGGEAGRDAARDPRDRAARARARARRSRPPRRRRRTS